MGQVSNRGTQSVSGADIDVTVGDTGATSPVGEKEQGSPFCWHGSHVIEH